MNIVSDVGEVLILNLKIWKNVLFVIPWLVKIQNFVPIVEKSFKYIKLVLELLDIFCTKLYKKIVYHLLSKFTLI